VRCNFACRTSASSPFWVAGQGQERTALQAFVQSIRIKVATSRRLARNLSGGNHQKTRAGEVAANNSDVIIFDEPTRGIDVGAKSRSTSSSTASRNMARRS